MKLPNNYGAISQLSGNRRRPFMVRKHLGQNKYIIVGYYETKEKALQALAAYNRSTNITPVSPVTLSTLFTEWIAIHNKSVKSTTARGYHTTYKHIHDIASIPIHSLTYNDYQAIIDGINSSYATKKKVRSLLNNLCNYAIKKGLNIRPIGELLELGKQTPVRPHKPFSRQMINRLWTDPLNNDIALILLYTGMRCGELLNLTKKDINLKQKTLIVRRSKTLAGQGRIIPLHPRIIPLIERRYTSATQRLFNETYNQVRKLFKDITKGKHTTHDCRHTVASLLDTAGANPVAVRAILGHKCGDITTRVYTHKRLRELRKTIHLLR